MKIPENENTTIKAIDRYFEKQSNGERYHLGVSMLGHKCDRYLWYSFRWAFKEKFEGRILRLFRRGHKEEEFFVKDLRNIGVDIRNTTSDQSRVNFGKHVSGSLDGIIESGLPEAPKSRHVAEFKTHSKKSFDKLAKDGMPYMHKIQLNTYMYGKNIDRGFYMAVCKDDDSLYTERIELDKPLAKQTIERAQRITMSEGLPDGMSVDPTWYECSYCPAKGMCHKGEPTKESNCRTCAHATVKEDSTWFCERWQDTIPNEAQLQGCNSHVFHPQLVPYEFKPYDKNEWNAIYIIDGVPVINGEDGFKSSEIAANPLSCAHPDNFINELRDTMGAMII